MSADGQPEVLEFCPGPWAYNSMTGPTPASLQHEPEGMPNWMATAAGALPPRRPGGPCGYLAMNPKTGEVFEIYSEALFVNRLVDFYKH